MHHRAHAKVPKSLAGRGPDPSQRSPKYFFAAAAFLSGESAYLARSRPMFANLLPFRNRDPASHSDHAFVREVTVKRPVRRSRRSERLIVFGWGLIALKCWGTFWMVKHYAMPLNPWWIVLPTLTAAALCTWVYLRRN